MTDFEVTQKKLEVGDYAPDLTLQTHNEGELNLKWYRGRKNVVLAFYPGDWTPVCSNQIQDYKKYKENLEKHDCQLFAISVDSIYCHIAWAKSMGNLSFPLMADYYPHGAIAKKYGVLSERGYANRVVFLIDKEGIIRFIEELDFNSLPNNNKLVEELAKLAD